MNKTKLKRIKSIAVIAFAISSCFNAFALEDASKKEPFYVNNATIYITPEDDASTAVGVTCVSEGIWARKFSNEYQFYDLQGNKFTDSRWIYTGHTSPRMSRWGMILKKAGADYYAPFILVKPNGQEVELPEDWSFRTIFVDSLAIAQVKEGNRYKFRYITPDLKVAFPELSPIPNLFEGRNDLTPPVSEGLRAYYTKKDGYELWGYIDAQGNIVIEPQFRDARSFHCGLALVTDTKNDKYFINKEGKKAFDLSWRSYENVSDFDSGICAAPGDRFDQTNYYDKSGNYITSLKRGSPFHKGYAYHLVHDDSDNKDHVHRINKEFNDAGTIGVTSSDYDPPVYDEIDVAHFKSRMVDGAACNGEYFYDYTIGLFSKDGFAPATMVKNDGKTTLKGFIDRSGYFKIVYEEKTR